MWCIPVADATFIACMEDILDLYEMPYNPKTPLVCFNETTKQLIMEKQLPLSPIPGHLERYDYEYKRNGVRNLFIFFEPLIGQRRVMIRERRTKHDFAYAMKFLVDDLYPQAECIIVVLDNLNTHTVAALYETLPPEEAHRLRKKLDFHYTPKHASWLNMAEIEFSIFARKCLAKRIPNDEVLHIEVDALEDYRNKHNSAVDWKFTTDNARIKLKHLYPSYLD